MINLPKPVLSVIIPLYNDKNYIDKCVSSVLGNKSNQIEIIISDDHSTDGSLDICKGYIDDRVKIIRPKHHLGTVKNWLYGLSHSRGRYIYFLAGDDYLAPRVLDQVIVEFDGQSIYTAPMNCFDDKTGSVFDRQMYPGQYSKMFLNNNNSFIKSYLYYYNHDEMILNFFPRKRLVYLNKFIRLSVSSVFWFWVALIFENSKVKHITKVVLFKRYNHPVTRPGWKTMEDKSSVFGKIVHFLCETHIYKSFCDIYNSFVISINLKSLRVLARLLFSNRRIIEKKTGLFGLFPKTWNVVFFRPNVLIEFILSPLMSVFRLLKRNLHR